MKVLCCTDEQSTCFAAAAPSQQFRAFMAGGHIAAKAMRHGISALRPPAQACRDAGAPLSLAYDVRTFAAGFTRAGNGLAAPVLLISLAFLYHQRETLRR